MFNLGRFLRFAGNLLKIAVPCLAIIFILALLTEILTQDGELLDLLSSGKFWLAVGLDMIPAIIVLRLALWLASRFVQVVYRLDTVKDGFNFLLYSRCGQPTFKPWKLISQEQTMGAEIVTRMGGPGNLLLFTDSAVVLERAGRLTRVEGGGGFFRLEPFEKIYDIIDLRPKDYNYTVSAITKDGIPIKWDVKIRYQIDDGGQVPTPKVPYPFSREAVLRAAACKWRREEGWRHGQDMDWEGLIVISRTEGILRSILARRYLEQLIGLTEVATQAARQSVQKELEERLSQAVPQLGAKILEVKLDNLKVDDEVTQQWIKNWQAQWKNWSLGLLAQAEGRHIYLVETAKAEAQVRLLVNITQSLQSQLSSQAITPKAVTRMVLMRLFSALDRADVAASYGTFFPTEALKALENMRQLVGGDSG